VCSPEDVQTGSGAPGVALVDVDLGELDVNRRHAPGNRATYIMDKCQSKRLLV